MAISGSPQFHIYQPGPTGMEHVAGSTELSGTFFLEPDPRVSLPETYQVVVALGNLSLEDLDGNHHWMTLEHQDIIKKVSLKFTVSGDELVVPEPGKLGIMSLSLLVFGLGRLKGRN